MNYGGAPFDLLSARLDSRSSLCSDSPLVVVGGDLAYLWARESKGRRGKVRESEGK